MSLPQDTVTRADFIPWTARLELGLPEMDRQHQHMIGRVNRLADAIVTDAPPATRLTAIDQVLEAAHAHFDWEEALMAEYGYTGLPHHHDQHSELLASIERLRDELHRRHHTVNTPRTLQFLRDWVELHIVFSDAAFVHNCIDTATAPVPQPAQTLAD